jgi:hypothetical protein
LVLVATVELFAFFMLPTQMHQRYLVPAAVVAALLAGASPPATLLVAGLAAGAAANQGLDLWRAAVDHAAGLDPAAAAGAPAVRGLIRTLASLVAAGHVALFAWALRMVHRETASDDLR